ncbi:Gfo/Idh/MocA family protein [Alicyclobacillus dauci]|uniref:Gfo/Idh/MocA family oxidoreductase n=1 Tax=Alicyclobacillus dauci TaxID=1475485 RepID=A0ABY6Z3G7_9BACL|nr:Gfo/Idh/MocA family oxidoreductase [Alicyclobacillus dauci]WAH37168.1 Gfo/Idh/MocA family oxidoreductase [Alicyclobacillus dauci]
MQTIRWGVLSTARIAEQQLIPAIKGANNAELLAVASRDEQKGQAFASRLGIPKVYGSYEALLEDPDIDAVYIPLPNHLHAEWTIKAAEKRKHVLCEKPAGLTAEQAKQMTDACKQAGVVFAEAFMYQHHPLWKRVHEVIRNVVIGDVRMVNANFSFPLTREGDIRLNPIMGGGALYDVGSYCVHAIRTIASDARPVKVTATANFAEDGVVDKSLAAAIRFENGILAHFDCSFEVTNRQHVEIVGTEGTITIPWPFRPDKGEPKLLIRTQSGERTEMIDPSPMYVLQVEDFGRSIENGTSPLNRVEDTLHNMEIIDMVFEAAGRKSVSL